MKMQIFKRLQASTAARMTVRSDNQPAPVVQTSALELGRTFRKPRKSEKFSDLKTAMGSGERRSSSRDVAV
jgi:hypothetical protein